MFLLFKIVILKLILQLNYEVNVLQFILSIMRK